MTAVAYGDMPLFLFHLLEFMDVDYEIDVEELNRRWAHPGNVDEWTQFILKQTDDAVGADHAGAGVGHLAHRTTTGPSRTPGATPTGTRWPTHRRRSTCASPTPAATAIRAPTSVSS